MTRHPEEAILPAPASSPIASFHDMRLLAANAAPVVIGDGDAWLSARRMLDLPDGPVTVGALWLSGQGHVRDLPGDEYLCVLSGELTIRAGATTLVLAADASGVVPGGIDFDWTATPGTVAIVMRCTSGPAGATAPLPVDETAPLAPSNPPLAELLIGETPSCRSFADYRSATTEFSCGTWDSTPYHRAAMLYRHYELMHLLEGSVTFVDTAGATATFSKGDVFLAQEGAEVAWESRVYVKKVFAFFRAA